MIGRRCKARERLSRAPLIGRALRDTYKGPSAPTVLKEHLPRALCGPQGARITKRPSGAFSRLWGRIPPLFSAVLIFQPFSLTAEDMAGRFLCRLLRFIAHSEGLSAFVSRGTLHFHIWSVGTYLVGVTSSASWLGRGRTRSGRRRPGIRARRVWGPRRTSAQGLSCTGRSSR